MILYDHQTPTQSKFLSQSRKSSAIGRTKRRPHFSAFAAKGSVCLAESPPDVLGYGLSLLYMATFSFFDRPSDSHMSE
jgi:hypothetical protein